jgi:pimeloyl-ACP methyl ester carboxylesterase
MVKDLDLIRPDYLTGYKTKKVFDTQQLQGILPHAVMQEVSVPSPPSSAATAESVVLNGISVNTPEAKATVLYFGGNLSHVDDNGPRLARIASACPMNYATFDYRGYGRSMGVPDVLSLRDDALKIYDSVRAKTTGKLIVHGYSLGSFIAGFIAANRTVDALVLEGSGTTPYEVIQARIPWYYKPFVTVTVSDNLKQVDNRAAVANYSGKALLISGENDVSTPEPLARRLYDSMPSTLKEYVLVPNGTHYNLLNYPEAKKAYCNLLQ